MKKTKPFRLAAMTASLFLCPDPVYHSGLRPEQRATAGNHTTPGRNGSPAGNPEPVYPGWHRNGGGQRHRPGRQGILYHYHSG